MVASVRGSIAALTLLVVAGCNPTTHVDDRQVDGHAKPHSHKPVRKRACIEELTANADPRLHALLRSLCAEWVQLEIPGVALAVVSADPNVAPVHIELGVRCFGDEASIEASTPFRLGSISKTITAALALGLVEEREDLQLTSDAALIAGFVSQAGLPPPQLGALLRHSSGLGEIEPAKLVDLDGAWLPALAQSPAAGSADEHHYSNAGYSVVGAMLEAVTGQPFATLIDERIAKPLGLRTLTAETGSPAAQAAACGHLAHDRDRHPIRVTEDLDFMPGDPRWMTPAGGLLSSATDLAQFALALGSPRLPGSVGMLERGDLLPPERVHSGHRDERYGQGLRSWALEGEVRAFAHSGNNGGFAAELLLVPGRRAIVLLANRGLEMPATLAAAEALLREPSGSF
jgi:CubicO group peptidase (beta-lactamase class C family)